MGRIRQRLAQQGDRGSVTLMMVVAAAAMLIAVGLVVDGGAKIAAVQQATRVAAEAARAGAQQVDVAGVQAGSGVELHPAQAQTAARAALAAAGVTGSASATLTSVEVTAVITKPTTFLSMIGIRSVTGTGSAIVELVVPPARAT
ncbi:MAG: pilus assembly protein TadG-related protein [Candidatus Nanopelagicales bacterium]